MYTICDWVLPSTLSIEYIRLLVALSSGCTESPICWLSQWELKACEIELVCSYNLYTNASLQQGKPGCHSRQESSHAACRTQTPKLAVSRADQLQKWFKMELLLNAMMQKRGVPSLLLWGFSLNSVSASRTDVIASLKSFISDLAISSMIKNDGCYWVSGRCIITQSYGTKNT